MSSIVRQFLMWWFSPPESPWICGNMSIDVSATQDYLARINENLEEKVSLNNFLCQNFGFPICRDNYLAGP